MGENSVNYETYSQSMVFLPYNSVPYPVEVFAVNGTALYINPAMMKLYCINDPNLIVGRYNLRKDPRYRSVKSHMEAIKKAFSGELVSIKSFPPPVQGFVNDVKPTSACFLPIIVGGKVRLVLAEYRNK